MKAIAIVSQKGGAGKSTLTRNLAVAGPRSGIIDLDPQGTTRGWWQKRGDDWPLMFEDISPADIQPALAKLSDLKAARVFIDTPPSVHKWLADVLKASDLALVPVRPSPDDLAAIGPTLDLIEKVGTPFAFVIMQAPPRARLVEEAARVLAQHGRVAPVNIGLRIAYAECGLLGQGVTEGTDKKAAKEITELSKYVNTLMRKEG
jgi:chromosome partitioning protein